MNKKTESLDNKSLNFKKPKRERHQLYLERIYYISVDPYSNESWLKIMGEKAFLAWLQLQTLVDRSEESVNDNKNTVPRSLNSLIKLLGVGRQTFYEKILKVLWNYAFIDLEEYSESTQKGHTPINIIVYPYPQNNLDLAHQPLVKVRDYDTEYSSAAKTFNNPKARSEQKRKELELNNMYPAKWAHDELLNELRRFKVNEGVIHVISFELTFYPTTIIPIHLVKDQLSHMYNKQKTGEPIYDFPKYFVSGVVHKAEAIANTEIIKELQMKKQESLNMRKGNHEFYNWLTEDFLEN